MRLYKDSELEFEFGVAGDWDNFVQFDLPYEMRIAWDLDKKIARTWCHKKIRQPLVAALTEVYDHYGKEGVAKYGLDLFGGIVNYRKMRGSTNTWSRHSWGIAIDLNPTKNALRTKKPEAWFSREECKPLIDIFKKHGFINYGDEKGFDWMHFEFSKK
jgi:hypothetical protein